MSPRPKRYQPRPNAEPPSRPWTETECEAIASAIMVWRGPLLRARSRAGYAEAGRGAMVIPVDRRTATVFARHLPIDAVFLPLGYLPAASIVGVYDTTTDGMVASYDPDRHYVQVFLIEQPNDHRDVVTLTARIDDEGGDAA